MNQKDLAIFLGTVIIYFVSEITMDSIKKSPLWVLRQLTDPIYRLFWGELSYLYHIKTNSHLKSISRQYVTLQAIKARPANSIGAPGRLLDLLNESIGGRKQIVVLGEPGSGKTTSLEALAYRLAREAYQFQLRVWIIVLLLVSSLVIFFSPWCIFLIFGFRFLDFIFNYWPIPVLIELRHYEDGNVEDFLKKAVADHVGGERISNKLQTYVERSRIVWLLDGMNEIKGGASGGILENWRETFRQGHYFAQSSIVITSRTGENPAGRLAIENIFRIVDLDNDGVLEFLRAYGSKNVVEDLRALTYNNMLEEHGLGRNPYWLKMMVESDLYTRNRGALFENFTRHLIQRELDKGVNTVSVDAEMDALSYLAYIMSDAGQVGIALEKAKSELENWLKHKGLEWTSNQVLHDADSATLLRLSSWEERVEFSHELVQEFYTTYALRLHLSEAIRWFDSPKRWRVLAMLGGLLEEHTIEGGRTVGNSELSQKFFQSAIGDGKDVTRLLLTIGLLWSVDKQDEQFQQNVISTLAESLLSTNYQINELAILELQRIIGEDIAVIFGDMLNKNRHTSNSKIIDILSILRSKKAVAILIEHLTDPIIKERVRNAIVSMREVAIEPLIDALRRSEEGFRQIIVSVLVQIGSPTIEPLIDMLRRSEDSVRQEAVAVLVRIGGPAVPPLIEALGKPEISVRRAAVVALGQIGDVRGLEALTLALGDENSLVRWDAEEALKRNGTLRKDISIMSRNGVIYPTITLELDEEERILYYCRRHWLLLVTRVAVSFGVAVLTLLLAAYRALGGVFFARTNAVVRGIDLVNLVYLILMAIILFWWMKGRERRNARFILNLFSDTSVVLGLIILGLVVYFRYNGGVVFWFDPNYRRGGDVVNLILLLLSILSLAACIYIFLDWANDFLILTSKRVVYDDSQLLIRHIQMEILLEDIKDVGIRPEEFLDVKISLLNRLESLLDTGTIVILPLTSFGPRYIAFGFAAKATIMQQRILSAMKEARARQETDILSKLISSDAYSNTPHLPRSAIYVSRRLYLENRDLPFGKPNPEFDYTYQTVTWRTYWQYQLFILLFPIPSYFMTINVLHILGLNGFLLYFASSIVFTATIILSYFRKSRYGNNRYTISRDSISVYQSLRKVQKKLYNIPIHSITNVKSSFNFVDRIVHCGNVIVETRDAVIIFYHVPDPQGIQMTINDYRGAFQPEDNDKV